MAHLAKYTRAAAGHMHNHYARSDYYREVKRSNENIDPTRTHLNYNLAAELQPLRPGQYMTKRLSEVRCQKREDVNIMCDWVITEPQELLHQNRDREFFEATYEFLRDRYGSNNVLSAYVHMDEVTPHMHFSFIPVTEDKKRGGEKVSAKEVINRTELKRFHVELQQHLERKLGCLVPILNLATRQGNQSIEELKRGSALKKLEETEIKLTEVELGLKQAQWEKKALEGKMSDLSNEIEETTAKKAELQNDVAALQGEIEFQNSQKEELRNEIVMLQQSKKTLSASELENLKCKKGTFGTVKGLKYEDFEKLLNTADKASSLERKVQELQNDLSRERSNRMSMGSMLESAKAQQQVKVLSKELARYIGEQGVDELLRGGRQTTHVFRGLER